MGLQLDLEVRDGGRDGPRTCIREADESHVRLCYVARLRVGYDALRTYMVPISRKRVP